MKKSIPITILLLLLILSAEAQNRQRGVVTVRERRSVTISAGLQLAVPKGEFADNYDGNPFGVNASVSIPLLGLPFEFGGGFAWNRMGGASQDVEIANNITGTRDRGKLNVNGNAYTYQLHGRFRPFDGKFRPYGELFAGVRNFSVRSELNLNNANQASGDLLERDFTFLAGYAIGAKYQLTTGIFIEARFDSQVGSRATYIDPESVVISDTGNFTYSNKNSRTDQWALSLGVAFSF